MPGILTRYKKTALLFIFMIVFLPFAPGQKIEKPDSLKKKIVKINEQEIDLDTLAYYLLLDGPDSQFYLNYALMNAAAEGDSLGITWLFSHGADVNAHTNENVTPLIFAVASGHKTAVKLLLEMGALPDTKSMYSETPLIIAVKNQNLEIAEILLRYGADPGIGDKFEATPLHYASVYGYFYVADLLIYYEAPVYKRSTDGTTPLMAAVWAGFADVADLLMQNGADPSENDNSGFTPFLIAAQNGDTLIMNLLLKRRVNIYAVNKSGYNALALAVKGNHKDAVSYLIRIGDKWNSPGRNEIAPVTVATIYRRDEIREMLLKNNFPVTKKSGIDQLMIIASLKHCLYDYQTGISVLANEPFLNLGIMAGLDFKPFYTRVLVKEEEDLYYQYRDKSAMVYAGISKEIALTDYQFKGNWSFIGSLSVGYTFGNKLEGTSIKPGNEFKFIPSAGFKWTKNKFSLLLGLEYLDTDYYKVGPIWLRIGFARNIFFNSLRAPGKVIKWY
jgi:ankyrin repeat protein